MTASAAAAAVVAAAATAGAVSSATADTGGPSSGPVDPSVLEPIDPQNWVNMDDMTADDYTPVPVVDWNEEQGSEAHWRGAIVLLDFENQPFVITEAQGEGDAFGNPTGLANSIPREDVPEFYASLLNEPSELNGGRTIHEYWMEQTGGRWSIDLTAYGAYQLPGHIEEYGLADRFNQVEGSNDAWCPQGLECDKNIRNDAIALWSEDTGYDDPLTEYDMVFWVTAGNDESGTWEEFGQMIFEGPEEVTDEFGPPRDEDGNPPLSNTGEPIPNWAPTRYVDWTSWRAAAGHWPNAQFPRYDGDGNVIRAGNSTQAETSGMGVYAHEFAHIVEIGDNYGNPYGTEASDGGPLRDTSGPFDVMARGTFNGPGGTHARYGIPSVMGAAQPAGVALRNRITLDTIDESSIVDVNRSELAEVGSIAVDLQARVHQEDGVPLGINLRLDEDGDRSTGTCSRQAGAADWDCDGGNFDNYTLEVIDRMGTDSFIPDHGVMIAKTKDEDRLPFIWTIDANPQDIEMIDYVMPDGTPVPVTRGDQRQLNDALFHAGIDSGSEFEYVDEHNDLHFYIADTWRDERGLLQYTVAVRSTEAEGLERDLELGEAGVTGTLEDELVQIDVPVTNTSDATGDALSDSDIYRISTEVSGGGWASQTPSEIVTVATGEELTFPVYAFADGAEAAGVDDETDGVSVAADSSMLLAAGAPEEEVTVTVTVTSENDPSATETVTVVIPAAEEEPEPTPTDPGTDPTDPGTDPGTDPTDPGTDPGADPTDPADGGTDPGTDRDGQPSPKAGDSLVVTGAQVGWLLAAAVLLFGLGAVLMAARRKTGGSS